MSATNRSAARDAHPHDFYETPPEVTRTILPFLPRLPVLDPCVGDRAILDVVETEWSVETFGLDINPGSRCSQCCDALSARWPVHDYPLVLTNPPYKLAQEFVARAIAEVFPVRGTVAMLLRLPFLESKKRATFHRRNPSDVFVLAERPSFTGDGKTDATAYAWFVWGPGRGGRWQILDLLGGES